MFKNTLFFNKEYIQNIKAYANRLNDERLGDEVGYYNLVNDSKVIIDECKKFKNNKKFKNIILIGMGGSSCGVKALKDFLYYDTHDDTNLFIIDNTSTSTFIEISKKIHLNDSLFIISSKTGTTIEVISIFKLIIFTFKIKNEELNKYFIFITDHDSKLHNLAKSFDIRCFFIPKNVGGRFSILSAIGIVPLILCGYDVDALLSGAKDCYEDFFIHEKDEILQKAYHYCTHKNMNINVLFSYGDEFKGFNEWFIQLFAESLGKKQGFKRIGITPIALIGARDQHSFLQLIMDGPKDKAITFLKVKNTKNINTPIIPDISLPHLKECDFTNGIKLQDLLNTQCDATIQALKTENISIDLIELDSFDAWHFGYLIFYYELLTSACGIMLGINTYNQPGVELGKLLLKKILSK